MKVAAGYPPPPTPSRNMGPCFDDWARDGQWGVKCMTIFKAKHAQAMTWPTSMEKRLFRGKARVEGWEEKFASSHFFKNAIIIG